MGPNMPIPDNQKQHAEIIIHGQISDGGSTVVNTQNVFHFRRTALTGTITKAAISSAFQTAIAAKLVLALNERWSQLRNSIRFINDALDQYQDFSNVNVGAITGDCLQSHSSIFILLRSGYRGRSWKGGKHFGPVSESDATSGGDDILNAGAITRFNTLAAAILAGFTDSNGQIWVPFIVSRDGSVIDTNPTTVVGVDVTEVKLNKRVSSHRGRKVASVY